MSGNKKAVYQYRLGVVNLWVFVTLEMMKRRFDFAHGSTQRDDEEFNSPRKLLGLYFQWRVNYGEVSIINWGAFAPD